LVEIVGPASNVIRAFVISPNPVLVVVLDERVQLVAQDRDKDE
jgi:hypothetical protein